MGLWERVHQDVDVVPKTLPRMEAATRHGLEVYGARTVDFTTDDCEHLRITFQASNVTGPILVADAFLEAGFSVSMDGDNNVVITLRGSVMKVVRRLQS